MVGLVGRKALDLPGLGIGGISRFPAVGREPTGQIGRTLIMNTNTNLISRKSPLALAKQALEDAQRAIPAYSSKFSRHDYTQHQLHALLALRRALRTDYRGLEALLRDWPELRETLGLERVPDHSTLQRAARRLEAERRKARPKAPRNVAAAPVRAGGDGASLFTWAAEQHEQRAAEAAPAGTIEERAAEPAPHVAAEPAAHELDHDVDAEGRRAG
jgi:hypothetical protein